MHPGSAPATTWVARARWAVPSSPVRTWLDDDRARIGGERGADQRIDRRGRLGLDDLAVDRPDELAAADVEESRADDAIVLVTGQIGHRGLDPGEARLRRSGVVPDGIDTAGFDQGRRDGVDPTLDVRRDPRRLVLDLGLLGGSLAVESGAEDGRGDRDRDECHGDEGEGQPEPDEPDRTGVRGEISLDHRRFLMHEVATLEAVPMVMRRYPTGRRSGAPARWSGVPGTDGPSANSREGEPRCAVAPESRRDASLGFAQCEWRNSCSRASDRPK